ncbi:hypothetical protein GNY16_20090 [Escherichia coli]|nr:hypothetical protein [Escherichia coli]EFI8595750.1 hypothetical protein [Escherichia coli]
MQDKESTNTEKLREFYRGAAETCGWLFWNCYRFAVATLAIYSGIILAGLLTADPDTATFRDFLLAMRSPSIWMGSAILAILWIGLKLILFPPYYPSARALGVAQGKASGSKPQAPE